jgi:uracil-DNA glycosylase
LDDAFSLLCLQVEWGADEALGLEPLDRLRPVDVEPGASRPARAIVKVPARPILADSSRGSPVEQAQAVASQSDTLDKLRAGIAGFDGCSLRATASNTVFAEGNPSADTLIIGEPPGREDDRGGHPFAGTEGQLLDQMLASIGLARSDLMLTCLLPWRPPGGRPPSPAEIAICLPFLHRLIVLLSPQRAVLFGASAARALLPLAGNRRRTPRGWVELGIPGRSTALPALVVPGLADMLKNPPLRRDAWAGLRLLRRSKNSIQT